MHKDWTPLLRVSALVLPGVLLLALHATAHAAPAASARDEGTSMEKLSKRRIFFGHQSVGGNILEGVRQLASSNPGAAPRIVEVTSPTAKVEPGTLAHAMVGQNEKPESKIADFARLMDGGLADQVDVAFFKLCYIDINGGTDVKALFEKYRTTLEELKVRHPRTTFVHVTAPLTTVQRGAKAWLKELMGKPVWGLSENVKREAFNQLMRQTYGGKEPLFDLAKLESTTTEGPPETYEINGNSYPALVPGYSDDGGHLNAAGQLRMAREFVAFLSALPEPATQPPAATQAAP